MDIPNYKLAAHIVTQLGLVWLKHADTREMSRATDEALKLLGRSQNSRLAVTCLKAIREYAINARL